MAKTIINNQGHSCPRSASVLDCRDSCKKCHRFDRGGHDQRATVFRDYLSDSERPVLRLVFRGWRNDD